MTDPKNPTASAEQVKKNELEEIINLVEEAVDCYGVDEIQAKWFLLCVSLRSLRSENEKLKDELGWIQELADSSSYDGGDTPEVRLAKIKMCCDDILSHESHE